MFDAKPPQAGTSWIEQQFDQRVGIVPAGTDPNQMSTEQLQNRLAELQKQMRSFQEGSIGAATPQQMAQPSYDSKQVIQWLRDLSHTRTFPPEPPVGPLERRNMATDIMTGGSLSTILDDSTAFDAYSEMRKLGFTDDALTSMIAWYRTVQKPSEIGQTIGGGIGGLAGLGLGQIPPFTGTAEEVWSMPAMAKAGASIGGAFVGGALGGGVDKMRDPDWEFNAGQLAKAMGQAGLEEGAWELAAQGIGQVVKTMFPGPTVTGSPTIPDVDTLNRTLAQYADQAKVRIGTHLTPNQMRTEGSRSVIQMIADSSIMGAGVGASSQQHQKKIVRDALQKILYGYGADLDKAGVPKKAKILVDAVKGAESASDDMINTFYRYIDAQIGYNIVRFDDTAKIANDIERKFKLAKDIGWEKVAKDITKLQDPSPTSFITAKEIRSRLAMIAREAEGEGQKNLLLRQTIKKDLLPAVDTAMEKAAGALSPEMRDQWRLANAVYKSHREIFDKEIMQKIAKEVPDNPALALELVRAHDPESIRTVIDTIGDKKKMQAVVLQGLIEETASPDVHLEGAAKMANGQNILEKYVGLGDEVLNTLFDKKQQDAFKEWARIATLTQQKGFTPGTGGMVMMNVGGLLAVGSTPFLPEEHRDKAKATGGFLLVGPGVLSLMLRKPWVAKLVGKGMVTRQGTKEALTLTSRILREVFKTRAQLNKEAKALEKQTFMGTAGKESLRELSGFGGRGY